MKYKKLRVLIFILIIIILLGIGSGIMKKNTNKLDNNDLNANQEDIDNTKDVLVEDDNLPSAPSNHLEFLNLSDGEYKTNNGYILTIKNGLAYIDDLLIVNKTYSLPEGYHPQNPKEEIKSERCNNCLESEVIDAFHLMQSDANAVGLNVYISSGYRSYSYQERLYNNYSAVSGTDGADRYSARGGHSEHQTGLSFDLNEIDDTFANTDEGKWVNNNAYLYGFIIRYPKGSESITGYQYESWHLRYVGVDLASKLYNNGEWVTLEEYYGISSSYE